MTTLDDPIISKVERPAEGKAKVAPKREPKPEPVERPAKPAPLPANVKLACDTLDSIYDLVATGLMMGGCVGAASALADSLDTLRTQNEQNLRRDAKLVAAINRVGQVGGRGSFFASQLMVFAPVAIIARSEISAKLEAKREAKESEDA